MKLPRGEGTRRWLTRLLSGKVHDPMIGRDVLIGILVGVAHPFLIASSTWIRGGTLEQPPFAGQVQSLGGVRYALGHVLAAMSSGALQGFVMIVVLVTFCAGGFSPRPVWDW